MLTLHKKQTKSVMLPPNAHILVVKLATIGDLLLAMSKPEEAIAAYRESLAIRRALVAKEPGNAAWRRRSARALPGAAGRERAGAPAMAP